MADEINTTVVDPTDDNDTFMELAATIDGTKVTIRVSGYGADQMKALQALYMFGQPERLAGIASEIDRAATEYFGDEDPED